MGGSPRKSFKKVYGVSFYRNALYMMANSAPASVLGFIFWVVAARVLQTSEVGFGSALLSAVALLAFIGNLGLSSGVIRYLPTSTDKARLLNFSYTLSALATLVVSLVFLGGLSWWSPELLVLRQNPILSAVFVIFTVVACLQSITLQVFVAFRRASFTLIQSTITSVVRLVLVIGLASMFNLLSIFVYQGVALTVSFGVGLLVFLPMVLRHYRPVPSLRRQTNRGLLSFSLINLISDGLLSLPAWVVPLMLLNTLGSVANAYFSVTWAVASQLQPIALGVASSIFAEGSFDEGNVDRNLKKGLKLIILLLIPAVVILLLLGDKVLLVFGEEYSVEGIGLLRLLILTTIPASLNILYFGIARVEKRLKVLLLLNGVAGLTTVVLSYVLLPQLGIIGVGVGWLVAQTSVTLFTVPRLVQKLRYPVRR